MMTAVRFDVEDRLHASGLKPAPIVLDAKDPEAIIFYPTFQKNLSSGVHVLKTVHDRIFQHWLKYGARDACLDEPWVHADIHSKAVFKAQVHDVEIVPEPVEIFLHRTGIAFVSEALLKHIGQMADRFYDIALSGVNRHPADGAERIIEKMRIELEVERHNLRLLLSQLDFIIFHDQRMNPLIHLVEAACQKTKFVILRFRQVDHEFSVAQAGHARDDHF